MDSKVRKAGFASIYIVVCLSSLLLAIFVLLEIALGFATKSVATSITTSAGQSVLGEYNLEMFNRYGIFAIRRYEDDLEKEVEHFASASTAVTKGVVKLSVDKVLVYTDKYPALDIEGFSKQLLKMSLSSAIKEKTDSNHELRSISTLGLPSKMLGYSSTESVLLSGGITELGINKIAEDEYILNLCSNKIYSKPDSYLAYEAEYVLYGYSSDAANLASLRRSLYGIRLAKRTAEVSPLPTDAVLAAAALAKAAILAEADVNKIVEGETVDSLDYEGYLRMFLAMLSREEKLARLMDIMQINLNLVDGSSFRFCNYAYGFDLNIKYVKKVIVPFTFGTDKRYAEIEQSHVYK